LIDGPKDQKNFEPANPSTPSFLMALSFIPRGTLINPLLHVSIPNRWAVEVFPRRSGNC
jgi:hypothetical protein